MNRRSAVAVLAGFRLAFAEDFWKAKPASEWSAKEGNRLRSHSPWTKSANVEMQGGMGGGMRPGGGGRRGGGGGGGIPTAESGGAGGGMAGGGMSGGMSGGMGGGAPDGVPPAPEVTIRWESAKPMQHAAALTEAPLAPQIAKLADQFYVISVSGMPVMFGGRRTGESAPDPNRLQAMQARLKQNTSLKRKDKPPLAPDQVGMVKGEKGPLLVFLFPRTEKIEAADKEVVFESSSGPMKAKTKFNLKDMMFQGELAL